MNYDQPDQAPRAKGGAEILVASIRGQIIRSELKEGDALPAESELTERGA
jgi:DNA-binding FadR family transcriptional regulator